jgi:hypothetical protein
MKRKKAPVALLPAAFTTVAPDFSGIGQTIIDGEFRWACWLVGATIELSIVGAVDNHFRRMMAPTGDELLADLDASFIRVRAQFEAFVASHVGYRATCTRLYARIGEYKAAGKPLPPTTAELLA